MKSSITDFFCYQISGNVNDLCAHVLNALEIVESKEVEMMRVGLKDRHYVLKYNADWVAWASYADVAVTVKHEAYHIMFQHTPRYLELAARYANNKELLKKIRFVKPIAIDMAVNTLLFDEEPYMREHHTEWVLPGFGVFRKFPKKKSYEWYTNELVKMMENEPDTIKNILILAGFDLGLFPGNPPPSSQSGSTPGIGIRLLLNHNESELSEMTSENQMNLADELRFQTKNIIRQAVASHGKTRGTIPAHLQELIEKTLKEPQVPWIRIFRNIVASGQRTHRRRSLHRPRRRHMGVPELAKFPGKKKDHAYNVAFLIDTSASMNSKELEMALNELEAMRKIDKDMTVTVVEADAAVERVYKMGSTDKVKYDVKGRGGTSFDPALKYAQDMLPRPDAVFYFTDGDAPAPRKENRVPCLFVWIITPRGRVPDDWGQVIQTKTI